MREILFKGKCFHNNEWVIGNLNIIPTERNYEHSYQIVINDIYNRDVYSVNKDTIGQYTGLKDKNGVKIFEGDLVKVQNILYGEIRWNQFRWMIYESKIDQYNSFLFININDIEVCGNIHDAKE